MLEAERTALVQKVFLLSPAKLSGVRARLLVNRRSLFPLARQLQAGGLPLADVFSFASALYFRGKITYARRFVPPDGLIRVITSGNGLADPDQVVTPAELRAFGSIEIDARNPRYQFPLRRDAHALAAQLVPSGHAVLLGSIATPKYRDGLLESFGDRLVFPTDFVGRGDMSRGALLLRAARAGRELPYTSVRGAILTGRRAPRISDSG